MAGRTITFDINTTGHVDSSIVSGFNQIKQAMKDMQSTASSSGNALKSQQDALRTQASALKQVSEAYGQLKSQGQESSAAAQELATSYLSLRGDMESTAASIQEAVTATEYLNNVDSETCQQIAELSQTIQEQESALQSAEAAYESTASQLGEMDDYTQECKQAMEDLKGSLENNKSALEQMSSAAQQSAREQQDLINASNDLKQKISDQRSELDRLKEAYQGAYLENNKAKMKELAEQIKKTSKEINENESAMKKAESEANSYDKTMSGIGNTLRSLIPSFSELKQAIANTFVNSVKNGIANIGRSIVDFGKQSIETGMNFQSSMSEVAAISGATGNDLDRLTNTAKEFGRTTQFSASESAQALKYMALAGWSVDDSIAGMPGVLGLAAASGMDLASASDMVTDYLSAFGMEAKESAQFADMLAFAQNNSNTTAQQLGEAFKNCAANLNAAGQDVQTTTSFLEAMANQGLKGAQAGTALTAVMRDITNSMQNGAITIGDTSVAVQDANGNFRDLTDIMKDVEAATQGMGDAERAAALSKTFTADSQKAVNLALNEGMENIEGYENALRSSTGAAQKAADVMNNNLAGDLKTLSSAWESVQIGIYEFFEPALRAGVQFLTGTIVPAIQGVIDWLNSLDFSGVQNAFSNMFGDSGGAILGSIAGIAGAVGAVTLAIKGWNKLKALNPFSKTEGEAQKSTSKISSFFKDLGSGIKESLQGAGEFVKTTLAGIGDMFSNMGLQGAASFAIVVGTITASLAVLALIGQPVIDLFQGISDAISSLVGGILQELAEALVRVADVFPIICSGLARLSPLIVAVGTAIGETAPFIEALGTAISDVVVAVGEGVAQIVTAITPAVQIIGSVFTQIVQIIADCIVQIVTVLSPYAPELTRMIEATSQAVQAISNAFSTLFSNISPIIDSITGLIRGLGDSISEIFNSIGGVIESVGSGIQSALEGVASVIESIGDTALKAGQGFEHLAQGAVTLSNANIVGLAANLVTLAGGITAISAGGWGIEGVANAFETMGQALETLNKQAPKASTSLNQIQAAVDNAKQIGPGMQEIANGITIAASTIEQGLMLIETAFISFSSSGSQATQTATLIATAFTNIATSASTGAGQVTNSISIMSSGFALLASNTTSAMTTITSVVTANLNKTQSVMSSTMSKMVSIVQRGNAQIKASFQSTFSSIAGIVQSGMSAAVSALSSGIAQMRALLNTTIEGPHIKLPHISVSGSFDLQSGSVPSFSVSYYKKGGIMNGATVFGVNGNDLMVGGEAGKEAILPLDELWTRMGQMLKDALEFSDLQSRQNTLATLASMPDEEAAGALTTSNYTNTSGDVYLEFNPTVSIQMSGSATPQEQQQIKQGFEDQLNQFKQQMFQEFEDKMEEMRRRAYGIA